MLNYTVTCRGTDNKPYGNILEYSIDDYIKVEPKSIAKDGIDAAISPEIKKYITLDSSICPTSMKKTIDEIINVPVSIINHGESLAALGSNAD